MKEGVWSELGGRLEVDQYVSKGRVVYSYKILYNAMMISIV